MNNELFKMVTLAYGNIILKGFMMEKYVRYIIILIAFMQTNIMIPLKELKQQSKIAIISLYDPNYQHIGKFSDENKEQYARKHGYDLFLYDERLDASRPAAWSKILAILNHLKDYKWIYWSDADSLVMNMTIKLEKFIDDRFDMIISKEAAFGVLNTGSFLIKNCAWSEKLLKRVYEQTEFIHHQWWEQAALAELFKKDPTLLTHVKILPQRLLNSNIVYGKWPAGIFRDGDFVIHFYGPCDKESFMKEWSQRVKYN